MAEALGRLALGPLWLGGAAALGVLACLLALLTQQAQMGALQGELAQLRGQLVAARRGETGSHGANLGPAEWGVPEAEGNTGSMVWRRGKRDSEDTWRQPDQRHQHRKRSVLHLVPNHRFTNDEGDVTEIWWRSSLHQGRALEVWGPNVTVKQTGLYHIYTQVLFHDPTFTMGQVLWRASPGGLRQILLRCVQSMPRELEQAYNSCYSAGIFQLQRGDQLSLRVPRANASLDLSPHGTFLGLLRL
uniref:THD domain-containing protein n=1 Tax=Pelusios castaneus TaxID=367368 RepID=A0A8C8SME4_9SAUR